MPHRRNHADDERAQRHRDRLLPQCRGVWLDRGELDKILERSLTQQAPAALPPRRRPRRATSGSATSATTRLPAALPAALPQEERRAGSASSSTDAPPLDPARRPRCTSEDAGMDSEPMEYVEIARAETERGELVLRERRPTTGPTALELRANGVFVMDTAETSSERALAAAALELVDRPARRAGRRPRARLHDAGGARRLSGSSAAPSSRSSRRWSTGCATAPSPTARRCWPTSGSSSWWPTSRSRSPRPATASYDLILLDVDNGPGYLVHDTNAALYRRAVPDPRARRAAARRRAGGLVGGRGARARGRRWPRCSARSQPPAYDVRLQERDETTGSTSRGSGELAAVVLGQRRVVVVEVQRRRVAAGLGGDQPVEVVVPARARRSRPSPGRARPGRRSAW